MAEKKQQPTITTFLSKVKKLKAKKGELLLLLPHPINFNVKMNPCGNYFRKHGFL